MASVQTMRTAAPALEAAERSMLRGFVVTLAIAVAAMVAALSVAHVGATPGIGNDEVPLYIVD